MSNKAEFEGNASLQINVDGKDSQCTANVVSLTCSCTFFKVPTAELVFADGGSSDSDFSILNSGSFAPGKEIEILMGYDDKLASVFSGVVVRNTVRKSANRSELVIEAKHKSFRMALKRRTQSYGDMIDSDVIERIIKSYGIGADVDSTKVNNETLAQYGVSDWDFINMRAEANGLIVSADGDGLKVKAPDFGQKPELTIDGSYSVYEIDAGIDARKAFSGYSVRAWNYCNREVAEETGKPGEYDTGAGDMDTAALAGKMDNGDYPVFMDSFQENNDAMSALLKAKMMRAEIARITGKAKIPGYELVKPGQMISIEDMGSIVNGENIVSSVTQEYSSEGWYTTVKFGCDDEPYALKYDNIEPLRADGTVPGVNGLQSAMVEQISSDPLGENRIQVRLHDGDGTLVWARAAMADAGDGRGVFFLPEAGDEVIVGFVNGNPAKPVVLGCLHSSQAPSPVEPSDENPKKGIYTKSGTALEFDDDKKSLTVRTDGGNILSVSDDDKGITISDQNGNKIVLNSDGITVESAKALTLKAKQDISVEGMNVTIKANGSFKAEGNAGAALSSNAAAEVKGAIVKIN